MPVKDILKKFFGIEGSDTGATPKEIKRGFDPEDKTIERQKQNVDFFKEERKNSRLKSLEISFIEGIKKDEDIFKSYIPQFVYKPPFGFPRADNPFLMKRLAKTPYIYSVIKTIVDETMSVKWDVKVKRGITESNEHREKIDEIKKFFDSPNENRESFEYILRQIITDILEIDAGVIVKVFTRAGKLSQIFARDGAAFIKNPDIYGYIGSRDNFLPPIAQPFLDQYTNVNSGMIEKGKNRADSNIVNRYSILYRERAAYFQYNYSGLSLPIPYGKRELIYFSHMPRSDDLYGISPVSRLITIILNLMYGAEFSLDFFTNNNMSDGILQLLGASTEQIDNFRSNFENQFRYVDKLGNKRKLFWKIPIVSREAKFTPFSFSSKEMEILKQQEWYNKIVWMCFGVNADEMGFTQDSNRAEGINQSTVFKRKAIKPLLQVLSFHINNFLITEFFDYKRFSEIPIEFSFDFYDTEEDRNLRNILQQEIDMGVKTPEMAAKELNVNIEELRESRMRQKDEELVYQQKEQKLSEKDSMNSLQDNKMDKVARADSKIVKMKNDKISEKETNNINKQSKNI